jgi:hypothetical protein
MEVIHWVNGKVPHKNMSYIGFGTQKYEHCGRELNRDTRTKIVTQDWMELKES